jgi:hypothetical protein
MGSGGRRHGVESRAAFPADRRFGLPNVLRHAIQSFIPSLVLSTLPDVGLDFERSSGVESDNPNLVLMRPSSVDPRSEPAVPIRRRPCGREVPLITLRYPEGAILVPVAQFWPSEPNLYEVMTSTDSISSINYHCTRWERYRREVGEASRFGIGVRSIEFFYAARSRPYAGGNFDKSLPYILSSSYPSLAPGKQ